VITRVGRKDLGVMKIEEFKDKVLEEIKAKIIS